MEVLMYISKDKLNFNDDTYISSTGEKIRNLLASNVAFVNKDDEIICCLKPRDEVISIVYDFNFRYIDGIQLMSEEVTRIGNLPEYEENVFYIVSDSVVNSIIAQGQRTIEDLYLVDEEDWSDEFDCYLSVGLRNASLI